MQEWDAYKGLYEDQQGTATELARNYMHARTAPAWVRQRVSAASVMHWVPHTQPGMQILRGFRHVMRCSCGHAGCYKVLYLESVARALQRGGPDPLACPAAPEHKGACGTFSVLVVAFKGIVSYLWPDAITVHDYQDVPDMPGSHFDECVILPNPAVPAKRFEIDGWYHFNHSMWLRQLSDVAKDARVRQLGVDMKRLHVQDLREFAAQVFECVMQAQAGLHYSPAYHQYDDLQ